MIKIKFKVSHLLVFSAALFFLGIGSFVLSWNNGAENCNDYEWINEEFHCLEKPTIDKSIYKQFRIKLESELAIFKNEGKIEDVAVYFRDLENGPTFGINESSNFIPASLFKVPVMLTYYKLAEEDPDILETELTYSSKSILEEPSQTIISENVLELDKPYPIDELIFRMIAYSDNRAYRLLNEYLERNNKSDYKQTFVELGLIEPEDSAYDAVFSAKSYGAVFRLLFNTSYLTHDLSERALQYLADSEYVDGLLGGVPVGVAVAHKFGERTLQNGLQLHDCGIVYYPDNPYLLCVMTEGDDFNELTEVIQHISKSVWDEVTARRL